MKRRKRIALMLGLLAILVGLIGLDMRQLRLDHALIDAICKNDTHEALTLLDRGADANACYGTPTNISVWRYLRDKLRRRDQQETAGSPALIMALFQDDEKVSQGSAENTVVLSALLDPIPFK